MLNRRGLLLGLTSALAAPAIVHAGNLMPIKVFAERIWMGDVFYSPLEKMVRVALDSGYSNETIRWADWVSRPDGHQTMNVNICAYDDLRGVYPLGEIDRDLTLQCAGAV